MKKTSYILILLLGAGLTAEAQNSKQTGVDGVSVSDVEMERNGAYIAVDMNLGL